MRDQTTTFHELYVRYSGDVYRFAHWLSGNADDARDITAETFSRMWTAAEPRSESVKAYLFAIARNIHRKQARRQSRNLALDDSVQELPDRGATPDEHAASQDELRRALGALRMLPELDRAVLLMRAEGGMSYDEISAATGISVAAAKVKVFRARARLAALLQPKPESIP